MATYTPSSCQYKQNSNPWWSPLPEMPTGWNGTGANKYVTRMAFPFADIRATNAANYIVSARLYIHVNSAYAASGCYVRATDSGDGVIATGGGVSGGKNSWIAIELTGGMMDALIMSNTAYLGTYGASSGTYFEFDSTNYVPYLDIAWASRTSACGPVTSLYVSPDLSEGNSVLYWSGASGGTNNPIVGYDIYFRDSYDGAQTWTAQSYYGSISSNSGSGSCPVAPSGTRGVYRQFQLVTCGSAGGQYDSGAVWSSNALLRNRAPGTPNPSFGGGLGYQGSPPYYPETVARFEWSAAGDPDGQPVTYQIQTKVQDANGAWVNDRAVIDVGAALYYDLDITNKARGQALWYNVRAVDSLGVPGDWVGPWNAYYRNQAPAAPLIAFPVNGATIYNTIPRIGFMYGSDPEGDGQYATLHFDNITQGTDSKNSQYHPEYWSRPGSGFAGGVKTLEKGIALGAGSHSFVAYGDDSKGARSVGTARSFTVVTPSWTDPTLAEGTKIKAAHIAELRTAVNNVRAYYGLPAYGWTDPVLTPGVTKIKAVHVSELRAAIRQIADLVNGYDAANSVNDIALPAWTDPTLTAGTTKIRAAHIAELRAVVSTL